MTKIDKRSKEYKRMNTGQQTDTSGVAAQETVLPTLTQPVAPPPLPTEYKPSFEDDGTHGANAYPGFRVSWWPDNPWGRTKAKSLNLTLVKAAQGYVTNADDFEQDTDGHLKHADQIAYVESIEHFMSRQKATLQRVAALLPKAGKSKGLTDTTDADSTIEERVSVSRQALRVEHEFNDPNA